MRYYIKGNRNRGPEVIKALEALGGVNASQYTGSDPSRFYFINGFENIVSDKCDSFYYELISTHPDWKEITLDPITWKYNVGDDVIVDGCVCQVEKQMAFNGKPYYKITPLIGKGDIFPEEAVQPYVDPKIKTWEDTIGSECKAKYFIDVESNILSVLNHRTTECDQNLFCSEKTAEASLAMSMIDQLMPHYGGTVPPNEKAYVITATKVGEVIVKEDSQYYGSLLRFRSKRQAYDFAKYNMPLIEKYLMLK